MNVIQFKPNNSKALPGQKESMKDGLIKRGQYYHFIKRLNGKLIKVSTKQTTRTLAKIWVEKNILKPLNDEALGIQPIKKIRFDEFVNGIYLPNLQMTKKPKTYDYYKRTLKLLQEFYADFLLIEITPASIEKYKFKRLNDPKRGAVKQKGTIKGITINKELTALLTCCNYAITMGYLKINPALGVKRLHEEPFEAKYISEDDFIHKFLPHANPRGIKSLTELYILAFYLGLRSSEVKNLKWKDVDLRNKIISIWETKTNTPRHLPTSSFIESLLRKLQQDHKSEFVFTNNFGRHYKHFLTGFKKTLKRAGLPDMRFHDLRHSFVTNCAEKGISWDKTSLITGHKSFQMYQKYRHFFDKSAREVVESFATPPNFR